MDTYGLIGYPLTHSFSRQFFSQKFQEENIPAQYLNFEIADIAQLHQIIAQHHTLKGLNVTIPYKEAVIPHLDKLSVQAQQVGAVNTIQVHRSAQKVQLIGHNTDVEGFRQSFQPNLSQIPLPHRALVLGTGGASKAVTFVLSQLNIPFLLVSRTAHTSGITYQDINEKCMQTHRIIINTTPLGTFPKVDTCPNIPYAFLTAQHYLFDLVYNPPQTAFLQEGVLRGSVVANGQNMLHIQAIEAWNIWQGNSNV